MANRAYLYSNEHYSWDAWERHGDLYYDSRWDIPLAWFFFFRPENAGMAHFSFTDSYATDRWQEPKFAAKNSYSPPQECRVGPCECSR